MKKQMHKFNQIILTCLAILAIIISINLARNSFAKDDVLQEEEDKIYTEAELLKLMEIYGEKITKALNGVAKEEITHIMVVHHAHPLFHTESEGEHSFVVYTNKNGAKGEHVLRVTSKFVESNSGEHVKQYQNFEKKHFSQINKDTFKELQNARAQFWDNKLEGTKSRIHEGNWKNISYNNLVKGVQVETTHERLPDRYGGTVSIPKTQYKLSDNLRDQLKNMPLQTLNNLLSQHTNSAEGRFLKNEIQKIINQAPPSKIIKPHQQEVTRDRELKSKYDKLVMLSKTKKQMQAVGANIERITHDIENQVKNLSYDEIKNLESKRPGVIGKYAPLGFGGEKQYIIDLWDVINAAGTTQATKPALTSTSTATATVASTPTTTTTVASNITTTAEPTATLAPNTTATAEPTPTPLLTATSTPASTATSTPALTPSSTDGAGQEQRSLWEWGTNLIMQGADKISAAWSWLSSPQESPSPAAAENPYQKSELVEDKKTTRIIKEEIDLKKAQVSAKLAEVEAKKAKEKRIKLEESAKKAVEAAKEAKKEEEEDKKQLEEEILAQ